MATTLDYLISELHEAQRTHSEDKIIAVELKLAEYHYNNSNFIKSKMFLNSILKKRKDISNIYYYLALIDINKNRINSAISNLDKELKINPKNLQAKQIKEKLIINNNFPLITIYLFLVNLLFFIFTYPKISLADSIKYGVSSFNMNFFSALTSMFFHINIWHFIMNMFILILFGIVLEKNIGSVNFFIVYLVSGLIANFTQAFFLDGGIVIGASGALFGILGSLMMREPLLKVRVFGFFQIPIIVLLGVFFFFVLIQDLWTGFAIHSTFIQGDLAHIIGIFIGILITAIMYKERIFIFYNWLFIISGFWLITLIVKYFISFGFNLSVEMLLYTVLLFVGILIIIYSYLHLKSQEEFKYQK